MFALSSGPRSDLVERQRFALACVLLGVYAAGLCDDVLAHRAFPHATLDGAEVADSGHCRRVETRIRVQAGDNVAA